MSDDALLTIKEATKMLGICSGRMQQIRAQSSLNPEKQGMLSERRIGRRVFITKASVENRLNYKADRAFRLDAQKKEKAEKRFNRFVAYELRKQMTDRVFSTIAGVLDGLTVIECAERMNVDSSVIRLHLAELRNSGRVTAIGKKNTPSGRRSIVWGITK